MRDNGMTTGRVIELRDGQLMPTQDKINRTPDAFAVQRKVLKRQIGKLLIGAEKQHARRQTQGLEFAQHAQAEGRRPSAPA